MYSSSKLNLGAFNTVSSHANVPPQSKHKQTIHYILNVDIFTVYFLGKISKKIVKNTHKWCSYNFIIVYANFPQFDRNAPIQDLSFELLNTNVGKKFTMLFFFVKTEF